MESTLPYQDQESYSNRRPTIRNKPGVVHLTGQIAGCDYVLGTLSFNLNKKELSYHLTYPDGARQEQLNYDTGEMTGRLHHITWHKNVAHIKRSDGIMIEQIDLHPGPLFCDVPILTPIFVESHYIGSVEPCLQNESDFRCWQGSQSQRIFSVSESSDFSILLFLLPSTEPTDHVLLGMQFINLPDGFEVPPSLVDICDESHRVGRIEIGGGWDMLVLTSRYTRTISGIVPPENKGSFRLLDYKRPMSAIADLIAQANGLKAC